MTDANSTHDPAPKYAVFRFENGHRYMISRPFEQYTQAAAYLARQPADWELEVAECSQ